jgi:3'-5' exoribonuclease
VLRQDGEYKINSYMENETKNGDLMAKLQLVDIRTEEKLQCVIWEDCLTRIEKRALKQGNIISIEEYDFNEKFNNVVIKQLKLIKEASIGLSIAEREELFKKIIEIVNDFKDQKLKNAVLELINKNKELFKTQPAARRHHHNYMGGLLQHIWECVEFAKALLPKIPVKINHELVLAGCVMHDFGKIFEYKMDFESGIIEKDETWLKLWISHIHYGFSWASERGFHDLAHLIASHHGIIGYGAMVEPQTREAELLHNVDWLSSRVGKISVEELEKV